MNLFRIGLYNDTSQVFEITEMAPHRFVARNFSEKLPMSIKYQILSFLKKGWFCYVRVSLKRDEYNIYMAQLSLQSLLSNLFVLHM